jgi:hypothetical protein
MKTFIVQLALLSEMVYGDMVVGQSQGRALSL